MFIRTRLLVLAAVATGACGGSVAQDSSDGGIDAATDGRLPAVPGGVTRWFAVQTFRLGTTGATGASDPRAWRDLGFDLDGRNTTADDSKTSTNSCGRVPGSPTSILADGNDGIDNAFGAHIMQIIHSLRSDEEAAMNALPATGATTLLLRLDNVGPDDNGSVPGAFYIASSLGRSPTFTEADVWPVTSDSLLDGATIGKPRFTFPDGYMTHGYWVAGDRGKVSGEVPLPLFVGLVPVALQSVTITFDTRGGGAGNLGGGAATTFVKTALNPGLMGLGICPGNATYDQVADGLTQSADLVLGAPNMQDTTKQCDALSIGIGFIARPTGAPTTVGPASTPPPDVDCH